jgi:transcriptional regulator with XRE-family HTH domain
METASVTGGSHRELLARNIRQIRRLLEMSQEEVAYLANLERSYLSKVERATLDVGVDNIGRIADALHVPLYYLFHPDILRLLAQES